jgi:CBS domain-containing protein
MHHGVITVPESASAADICRVMSQNKVSCVAVADSSRAAVGVVSSTDIMCCGTATSQAGPFTRAAAIMSSPLAAIHVDDTLQHAIETMVERNIHRVMVRSDGHVVGVLSTTDVVREIAKTVKGTPESIYARLERFEVGVRGEGESSPAGETVHDVMTHGVLMVPLTLSVRETAKVLAEKRVHRVIVTSDQGQMIGVVSAMDILKPWTGDYGSFDRDDVITADVMTQDIEAIEHWRTLGEAMERMSRKHIHALLVLLAKGEICGELSSRPIMATGVVPGVNIPVGLVSATDIVREIGRRGRGG